MSLKRRLAMTFEVFSRRQTPNSSQVLREEFSDSLRGRILVLYKNLVSGRLTGPGTGPVPEFWHELHISLQHLYGRPRLSDNQSLSEPEDAFVFLLNCEASEFFDFIELSFKLDRWRSIDKAEEIIDIINSFFEMERAPFRLTDYVRIEEPAVNRFGAVYGRSLSIVAYPKVIRTDEEVVHREAIEPALLILDVPHFMEANLRFREALDHYYKREYEDCLTKCGSSLESVLKAICRKKGWNYGEDENVGRVLPIVIEESGLQPFYKDPLMIIATIRNKLSSSHARGTAPAPVKQHVAQYALNSTAAAILLLVQQSDL